VWDIPHLLCLCGRWRSDLSPRLLLPPVYLAQERLRLVEQIGVRGRETVTVEPFEFTDHVEEATEDREHLCSIAMRATELHANSRGRVADHTPTFIHAFPPHTDERLPRHRKRTREITRGR
jgi:hypothetical protein